MREAITQNGITYFPGQGSNWLGTDGKKYVRRGPLSGTQTFFEINADAPYTPLDAGDAMGGGAGFTDTEVQELAKDSRKQDEILDQSQLISQILK